MTKERTEKTQLARIEIDVLETLKGMRKPGETIGQVITRLLLHYMEHSAGEEPVTPAQGQMSLFSEPVTTVNTDQIRDIVKDAVKEEFDEIKKEIDHIKESSNQVNTVNTRAEEISVPVKSQESVIPEMPLESDVPRMITLSDEMKKKLSDKISSLKAIGMSDSAIAIEANIISRTGKISHQKVSDIANFKQKTLPSDQIARLLNLKE